MTLTWQPEAGDMSLLHLSSAVPVGISKLKSNGASYSKPPHCRSGPGYPGWVLVGAQRLFRAVA